MEENNIWDGPLYVGITSDGAIDLFKVIWHQATSVWERKKFSSEYDNACHRMYPEQGTRPGEGLYHYCTFYLDSSDYGLVMSERDTRSVVPKDRHVYISVPIAESPDYIPKVAIEEIFVFFEGMGDFLEIGEKRKCVINADEIIDATGFFRKPIIPQEKTEEYEANCKIIELYKVSELLGYKNSTKEDCIKALEMVREQYQAEKGHTLVKKKNS